MRKTITCLAAVVCLVTLTAAAEDFWVKKKYTEWSEKECQKLLKDSPWAHEWSSGAVGIYQTGEGTARLGSVATETERQANAQVGYTFRLRSALPIRQAMVRRNQLVQGYDKMTEEQKKVFDQQAQQFLSATTSKVIVDVEYFSNVRGFLPDLANYWRSQNTGSLKDKVYLFGAKGARAELEQYIPPRGDSRAFQFVFPRTVEGRPIVGPEDKSLQVQIQQTDLSLQWLRVLGAAEQGQVQTAVSQSSSIEQVLVEFKVKKMTVDGELVF